MRRDSQTWKTWSKTIDDIFHSLSFEILDEMHEGNSSFMACIREAKEFGKGLDSKVKLYRRIGGRENLRSICMAVLLLNEELGRHSDRDGRVTHVLWECSSIILRKRSNNC